MTRAREAGAGRWDAATVRWMGAAHLVHDTYPAFLGVLLPVLIARFELSLAMAGFVVSSMRWTSLLQPLAGHVTDNLGARRFVVLATITTGACISAISLAPSVVVVVALLLVAGVSHSLFHPAAASVVSRLAVARRGAAMSIFVTGGEMGRAIGPLYIAAVLTAVGAAWAWLAVLPAVVMGAILTRQGGRLGTAHPGGSPAGVRSAVGARRGPIALLGLAVGSRSVGNTALLAFLPTLVVAGGQDLLYAGGVVAAYELGGAAGALLGGTASDRWGRRTVLGLSLAAGLPLAAAGLLAPAGPIQLALLAVAGMTLLSGTPVQLALMHELLPDNLGLATGLVYFTGTTGAILALTVFGVVGDILGVREAILLGLCSAVVGLGAVLLLPSVAPGARPGAAGVPALPEQATSWNE